MTEANARKVAEGLDGDAFHSGGNIWLVGLIRPDGAYIVISDDVIACYESQSAFDNGELALSQIALSV